MSYKGFLKDLESKVIDLGLEVHDQLIKNKIVGEGYFLKDIQDDLESIKIKVRKKRDKVAPNG